MRNVLAAAALLLWASAASAQTGAPPLYRVFLSDGTALSSYGEWARVESHVVFSMPLVSGSDPDQLHLVTIAADRVDWDKTERYADSVRAAHYAASRGEQDFARLSSDVARVINDVALVKDPTERLVMAERARQSLADWPGSHYGYRAQEVHELVGVLDEVIGGLRASTGMSRFDLALTATTKPMPMEPLLPAPDQTEVVQQLMTAATLVDTPTEKVSLLTTVLGILDRAVGLLPETIAATIRSKALGSIAEERAIDASYARLRDTTLASAGKLAASADIRGLERLRSTVQQQDAKLGNRRPGDVFALAAAIESHVESAHRLRLAKDQWLLRIDRLRAYQRETTPTLNNLTRLSPRLDDIRALAGPAPWRLRPLADLFAREGRTLSRIDPPAELAAVHALFRSATELALNAARLRLDAVESADLDVARRASSAAAGALMLLAKAKADLDAALRPPTGVASAQ